MAAPSGEPAITFQSTAYTEIGEGNLSSFLIGSINEADYTIVDAFGERTLSVVPAGFDASSGDFTGSWTQIKVPESGVVKVYGDPANIDVIVAEGIYPARNHRNREGQVSSGTCPSAVSHKTQLAQPRRPRS